MEIWELIVKSNTFNFIIMVALFAFIIKKCKLTQKLDEAIAKIKETIEKSEVVKNNSLEELRQADEKTKNIVFELEEIDKKAQENIATLKEKIASDAEAQVNSIKLNADKIIDAKEKEIISHLSKKTILASIEIARKHIINLLKQNPDYHQKFIRESIEEINRLR